MAAVGAKSRLARILLIVMGVGVPAVVVRFGGFHLDPVVAALIFFVGIVGAAFLLSWAAEVAELDISGSLAIALLALVAVLPEYAIEAVLAWDAGGSFDTVTRVITPEMGRVAANVTGANRLLIGLGWSIVILISWVKRRTTLDMRGYMGLEITMLTVATAVTFLIFFMSQVHVILAVALIALYLFYLWISSTRESEDPELVGTAALIGTLPTAYRRALVLFLFFFAAAIIIIAAEPFVDALVETGADLGIDDFILIQWIAPLASESPEIIVAVLFTLRGNPVAGLTILISSEVNQLTLLIGSMTLIFSASAGEILNFPLDARQSAEFLLMSSVSLFAILLIAPRLISWKSGLILLVLFIAHLFFTSATERIIFSFVYLGMAAALVIADRRRVLQVFRSSVPDS